MNSAFESPWFSCAPNPAARLRLYCFPNAGGGASMLYRWFTGLPPEIQLCPIQLPGRENRRKETPFTRILPLARALADVLEPHLDFPFAFFGHSLGALVAFELSRELRRRRLPEPSRLMVSARRSPDNLDLGPKVHHLPDKEFTDAVRRVYNALPDAILADPDVLQLFLPVLRADLEVIQTYVYTPEAPLACPISAYGGYEDPTTSEADLEGWRRETQAAFSVRMFPGDHFFPRNIPAFAQIIAQDLRATSQPQP